MGILRYIRLTFWDDIKENLFYMVVLIFSIVIIFHTFNIVLNEQIVPYRSKEYIDLSVLAFVILAASIMFMVFANSYYLEEKYKEYAVIALSGRSIGEICKIVIIRNLIITIISVGIGCLLGVTTSFPVMKIIFKSIGMTISGNYISQNAVVLVGITVFTELESVFLINTGSIYRKSITELVNRKRMVDVKNRKVRKVSSIIYILAYMLPLIFIFIPISIKDKVSAISFSIPIGIFGIQGIIRYVIPDGIANYRNKKLITDKCNLIIISNLYYSVQKSIALILVLIISVVLIISLEGEYKIGTVVNTMSLICYEVIIVVMSITVVYKFLIEAKTRRKNFNQLKLLGYTKSEIRKIIKTEVIVYYAIIILIALLYIILVAIGSAMAGLITCNIATIIVFSYLALFSLSAIVSYFGYRKLAV